MADFRGSPGALPTSLKAGVAALAATTILGGTYLLFSSVKVVLIVVLGATGVGLILLVYRYILKVLNQRRASPLRQSLLNNSTAIPHAVSDVNDRRDLDTLRQKFDAGVAKFHASGKDLYRLPWYLVVGESGGGKTEAIRKSSVSFPSGLNEFLKGTGGTIGMNWWFTNAAVILDTAGSLFMNVEPGTSPEWDEFLKMLLKHRPGCPINGMILVIPADTLIKDNADEIEHKASKIAQRLDHLQRTLAVRFPVFVMITKSDSILGFRDFFDTIQDPDVQHQILGWSNPASLDNLDTPFDPKLVEQHLQEVKDRLMRRRMGLLIDPVNTDNPSDRRIDQLDALYAMPEKLAELAPRLRRYLETVFVAGEWSPKPLFLRGIYFTSSLTKGSALDKDLADILGVPADQLPGARIFEQDRAFFLRDFFVKKVFVEKGLVTRSGNTRRLNRQRKVVLFGGAISAVLALLVLTWLAASRFKNSIGEESEFWTSVREESGERDEGFALLVRPPGDPNSPARYLGGDPVELKPEYKSSRAEFYAQQPARLANEISPPAIFKPVASLLAKLNAKRSDAYAALFERDVVLPVIKEARLKLSRETAQTWNTPATNALVQLLVLEGARIGIPPATAPATEEISPGSAPPFQLRALYQYVLTDDDFKAMSKVLKGLDEGALLVYAKSSAHWPPKLLKDTSAKSIQNGTNAFIDYWAGQLSGKTGEIAAISDAVDALTAYRDAEDALSKKAMDPVYESAAYAPWLEAWKVSLDQVREASKRLDRVLKSLPADAKGGAEIARSYQTHIENKLREVETAHQQLLAQLPPDIADRSKIDPQAEPLAAARASLLAALEKLPELRQAVLAGGLQARINELEPLGFLNTVTWQDQIAISRYHASTLAYEHVDSLLPPSDLSQIVIDRDRWAEEMSRIATDTSSAKAPLDELGKTLADKDRLTETVAHCSAALDVGAAVRRTALVKEFFDSAPETVDQFERHVAELAADQERFPPAKLPQLPFVKVFAYETRYNATAASEKLSTWDALHRGMGDTSTAKILDVEALSAQRAALSAAADAYSKRCHTYWTTDVPEKLEVSIESWRSIFFEGEQRRKLNTEDINEDIQALVDSLTLSAEQVAAFLPKDAQATASAERAGLKESLKRLDGDYKDRVKKRIRSWRELSDDSIEARRQLLALKASEFQDEYLLQADLRSKDMVRKYWRDVTLKMLEALAGESSAKSRDARLSLARKCDVFPLAPLERNGKRRPMLNPAELAPIQDLLQQAGAAMRTAGTEVGLGKRIQDGGNTDDDEVNQQLDALRGKLSAAELQWIDSLRVVTESLGNGAPKSCKISVLAASDQAKLREKRAVKQPLDDQSLLLTEGDLPPANKSGVTPLPASNKPLQTVSVPGKSLKIKKFVNPEDETAGRSVDVITVEGEWAAIAMLHTLYSLRTGDGKVWHVELISNNRSVWLQLEFEEPLPPLAAWPDPAKFIAR